jgi:type III secretory pathway lipoprotein EscJ
VIPEESPLRAMDEVKAVATAGVAVKYLPGAGGTKPLSEAQIQAIVAAGTEGLTADRVVVVMTPGGGPSAKYALNPEAAETSGSGLKRLSSLTLNILGVFALIALLGLGALLSVTSMQLSAVRGRLSRLQNEVSKAKRKPGDYTGTVV